ncbi:MAG: ABC transporter permease [Proteobacteria bacterium]|nr:ABC transporter permease [Pseudomonadota bacterium]
MPVILVTDVLVWLLVAAAAGYAYYCRRHDHLAAPWRRVFASRAAMVSLVVLCAYLAAGLADSLHFRARLESGGPGAPAAYSNEVMSLLDVAVGDLRTRSEKTYSAPFATRLYAKELIELPGGKSVRDYPRLRFGGAHLKTEADRGADVAAKALAALAAAVAVWGALGWALRGFARSRPGVPWRAAWLALGALLALAAPAFALSGGYHVLGTDKVGQDVFYLSLKSIRTSLVIGTLTTLVMLPLGAAVGIMAGYFKGWVDDVIQYAYTTLNSIPAVLLIAASVLMMQVYIDTHPELFPTTAQRADLRLLFLCVILGLTSWTGLARLLRGESLKLRELEYIQAAHAFGVSHARIIGRHILPNVMHIIIISLVMDFSGLVLAEAVLSYVGVGVDPSTTSFGTMINNARLEMAREPMVWWALAAAFWFMFVLVLVANLFADAVRDGFDPRVRVGGGGA